jgi:hypothetical protein
MNAQDWANLASVFRAGQERAAGWSSNTAMIQHAAILEAQADRCEAIARELDGFPPVEHDHYHVHLTDGTHSYTHAHAHAHGQGENGHDAGDDGGHEHEPAGPLFPADWGSGEELR